MPNILCPTCDSTLDIDDASVGQMVQCGSCQNVFKAVAAPPSEEDDRPSKRRSSKRDDEDDDEDDRPRRKSKSRRRDRDEDDDIDERPAAAGNGMATASLVLGIIAAVIELPSFGGTIFGAACCPFCGVLFWPAMPSPAS